jgi:hypothetical protein
MFPRIVKSHLPVEKGSEVGGCTMKDNTSEVFLLVEKGEVEDIQLKKAS